MLQFRTAVATETGPVRPGNEDSAWAGAYLALVADGVGGAAAGEVASATAAYVTAACALRRAGDDPLAVLGEAVLHAHEQLRLGIRADPSRTGMATTLTAIATDGERCALAHVGDSRAYLLRGDALRRISTDHTLVQAMVDAGELTTTQARTSPLRHVVLRSLDGSADTLAESGADIDRLVVSSGDRLMLCSDGVSDYLPASQLAALLHDVRREDAAAALVRAALRAGTRDNVTCVVVDVVDAPPVSPVGAPAGAAADVRNVVDHAWLPAAVG